MYWIKSHRYLCCLFAFLAFAGNSVAQNFSYVYIQGDKLTPFYIKLEGEMLPRYSKNYHIIPQLAAGPIHIQVLFQQNEYPSQSFTIQVPENGFRGFLLTRKGTEFALYDIQQRFYLLPGDAGEDHLPEMNMSGNAGYVKKTAAEDDLAAEPVTVAPRERPGKRKAPAVKAAEPAQDTKEPAFMDDIELVNEHVVQDNQPETETLQQPAEQQQILTEPQQELQTNEPHLLPEDAQQPAEQLSTEETPAAGQLAIADMPLQANTAPILNSDCPDPMGDARFDDIFTHTEQKDTDEKRISYLIKRVDGNCFSTRQAALLARKLDAESLRYSFLKKVYPRVTDQQNFPLLEQLFKTNEWKSYFQLIP